jgi:hypothetical protein
MGGTYIRAVLTPSRRAGEGPLAPSAVPHAWD